MSRKGSIWTTNSFKVFVEFWHLSGREKLIIVAIWVVGGSALWFSVGRPLHEHYTQVQRVMREQFALLPPPAGATITRTDEKGAFIEPPLLTIYYAFPGTCDAVQAYYADAAVQAGWSVTKAVYLSRDTSGDTRYDYLVSNYRKTARGSTLELEVDCRAHASAGDGYSIGFNLA